MGRELLYRGPSGACIWMWLGPLQQPRTRTWLWVGGSVREQLGSQPAGCFLCTEGQWQLGRMAGRPTLTLVLFVRWMWRSGASVPEDSPAAGDRAGGAAAELLLKWDAHRCLVLADLVSWFWGDVVPYYFWYFYISQYLMFLQNPCLSGLPQKPLLPFVQIC